LRIEAPCQAKRRALLGAFDPVRHRLLVRTSATKRSTDLVGPLDDLAPADGRSERDKPLVVVLDNGPIHTSKLTTKGLAERPWLTLEWLPKHAPELNAIEHCWRDLKRHHLANRTFADVASSTASCTKRSTGSIGSGNLNRAGIPGGGFVWVLRRQGGHLPFDVAARRAVRPARG
jgi:hypothetical protein